MISIRIFLKDFFPLIEEFTKKYPEIIAKIPTATFPSVAIICPVKVVNQTLVATGPSTNTCIIIQQSVSNWMVEDNEKHCDNSQ